MYSDDHDAPPFNPVPPVVLLPALAIAAVELVLQAAQRGLIGGPQGIGWRTEAITRFGFFDTVFQWMLARGQFPVEHLMRFVTYMGVHAGFGHALFAVVILLAIGKMVAELYSAPAFVAIFLASGVAGAVAYGTFLDTGVPLIGAFPAIYGLIGAMTFIMWTAARMRGENQFRAFSLIAFLLGVQLLFRMLFGGADDWVADIAGFVAGFALSVGLAPGGPARAAAVLDRIRRR